MKRLRTLLMMGLASAASVAREQRLAKNCEG